MSVVRRTVSVATVIFWIGLRVAPTATVFLVILRLIGVIAWPWWVICAPLWVATGVGLFVTLVVVAVTGVIAWAASR